MIYTDEELKFINKSDRGTDMERSVYEELTIDLITNCRMNAFDARKVVSFLEDRGIIDYDNLKEIYSDDEETD